MQIEIIQNEKHELTLSIDSITIAEILRVALYEQGAEFAAWRREHPSKPAILKIKSSDKPAKKVLTDTITSLIKECDKIKAVVKK